MAKSKQGAAKPETRELVRNRKGYHNFEILERVEAGLVLQGTEVKSLRRRKASLEESYIRIEGKEAWWVKGHIPEYSHGNRQNHKPDRRRKLLLRRHEIRRLNARVRERGLTLVPLRLYLSPRNLVKIEIALCRGKKLYDKRQADRKKTAQREMRGEG